MSITSTLVDQPVSTKLNDSASVFLIGYDDTIAKEDEPTEDEKADLEKLAAKREKAVKTARSKVFLLNHEHFVNLQKYLFAGGALPGTVEQFEAEYPEKSFGEFFDKEPTLYGVSDTNVVVPWNL
jgi:hypothetical protein